MFVGPIKKGKTSGGIKRIRLPTEVFDELSRVTGVLVALSMQVPGRYTSGQGQR